MTKRTLTWDPARGLGLPEQFDDGERMALLSRDAELLFQNLLDSRSIDLAAVASLELSVSSIQREGGPASHPSYEEKLELRAVLEGANSLIPFFWQTARPALAIPCEEETARQWLETELTAAARGQALSDRGRWDLILEPWCASQLVHEVVGHSLEADNFLAYMRPAGWDFGSRITQLPVTVVDNPLGPRGRGCYEEDDEGVAAEAVTLVDDGVLFDVLCDTEFAKRLGRYSNGHGRRTANGHRVLPRMARTVLMPGKETLDDLLADVKRGIWCGGCWGGGSQGGTFVLRPTYGRIIRNGCLTNEFVRRFDLRGSKMEVLSRIDGLGDVLQEFSPAHGCEKDGQAQLPIAMAAPHLRLRDVPLCPF